jgi:hypothetical protein
VPTGTPTGSTGPLPAFHRRRAPTSASAGARNQRKARYRGDRSQRLAAKPERLDAEQVIGAAQLAGGMARHRQFHLFSRNALAIIRDFDQPAPGFAIWIVIWLAPASRAFSSQLFHHRSRALDHLTGGNL